MKRSDAFHRQSLASLCTNRTSIDRQQTSSATNYLLGVPLEKKGKLPVSGGGGVDVPHQGSLEQEADLLVPVNRRVLIWPRKAPYGKPAGNHGKPQNFISPFAP
ncbi:rCG62063 [Anopheles sinensis]|uniref:RCG62063 n=1 Tax=Anopheles sinensis TaxID=74873 RepID=A0A084VI37_ANOSI|nr:rCG62063 [Anopheles sinensis]